MFIGLSGTAAASGLAVVIYEWHVSLFLIFLGVLYSANTEKCEKGKKVYAISKRNIQKYLK